MQTRKDQLTVCKTDTPAAVLMNTLDWLLVTSAFCMVVAATDALQVTCAFRYVLTSGLLLTGLVFTQATAIWRQETGLNSVEANA